MIAEHGRMSWQRSSGYNRRSLVETTMFRYKTIISRRLRARSLSNQRTEAKVGMQRAQPDDRSRHAGLRPEPLTRNREGETQPMVYSRTCA
jgi:hypothetical protein